MATKRYGKHCGNIEKVLVTTTNMYLVASSFSASLPNSKKGSQNGWQESSPKSSPKGSQNNPPSYLSGGGGFALITFEIKGSID
jgi:hypothetical protein